MLCLQIDDPLPQLLVLVIQMLAGLPSSGFSQTIELIPQLLVVGFQRLYAEFHLAHFHSLPLQKSFEELVIMLDLLYQHSLFLNDLVSGVLPP